MASSSDLHVYADDRARIDEILTGDERAFHDLVVEYHPLAYSLAWRTLGDAGDAEEVVQDAFIKIHEALGSFRGEASLKTWILRIVWRLSLNRRRDRARSAWRRLGLHQGGDDPGDNLPEPQATPEERLLSGERNRLVRDIVDDLPPALREVLILNSFEELGYEEIARVLDIPLGTVSSRIYAARRKLAARLRRVAPA